MQEDKDASLKVMKDMSVALKGRAVQVISLLRLALFVKILFRQKDLGSCSTLRCSMHFCWRCKIQKALAYLVDYVMGGTGGVC